MTALVIVSVAFFGVVWVARWITKHPTPQNHPTQPSPFLLPPPRRANGPALRVHYCEACGRVYVAQPGDVCEPCLRLLNPVRRAEEITREASS